MAVEKYVGRYVTAEDASQYIDSVTVIKAFEKIKSASAKLKNAEKKVGEAKFYCTKNHLSIEGNNMEDDIEICEEDYKDAVMYMDTFSDTIKTALQKALDKRQIQLNTEAQRKDEEITRQVEARQAQTTMIN